MVLLTHISSSREKPSFQLEPCHAVPMTAQWFGNSKGSPPVRLGTMVPQGRGLLGQGLGSGPPCGTVSLCWVRKAWPAQAVCFCASGCARSQVETIVRCFLEGEVFQHSSFLPGFGDSLCMGG